MKEKSTVHLHGIVQSGLNQAIFFTQLDWVKEQCAGFAGFTPIPGTLNVRVAGSSAHQWQTLVRSGQLILNPPVPDFCPALLLPGQVCGVEAAAVIPLISDYPADLIEILAPVKLREHLALKDGDAVEISFCKHRFG
ncbi:hypothetical protein JCM15765_34880 [Paradesulfitobacterium aromaticivorans]